ncbi:ATP synthase F1 subunit gamma [Mycoplasma zalophidermidis]|uniref:ATP synthase gamma chain n=1 Tax=Mycoplasma zalophidermidis TaxID=398174 RepID=A0ABS6DSF3_9MOLU|nr:ATP synthase F1 subunit gamma [Mycoplasma zalophidermidis]MBU4689800.1 ATP synthase F1 subunit gamma [Mycoplasma zalophidermidis]MBU4693945.1 ATP synthase F1 subunit gamma [Mycoplasma zalophidermidis]MCR8966575.1 ATP synthase F1 subunit gamma [Mycoplasma zalophidermidis]
MASLQKIKSRINTVESIRKITHAMELVSTSKMRKARDYFNSVKLYEQQVSDIFGGFYSYLSAEDLRDYFAAKTSKKRLFLVITSDLGLAGSYNSNVLKLVKNIITDQDELIVLGSKGISILEAKYKNQIIKSTSWAHCEIKNIAQKCTKVMVEKYRKNEVGEIHVLYNEFINNLVQQEQDSKLLPYEYDFKKNQQKKLNQVIEFEPSAKEILINTVPLYVSAKVNKCLASAVISEYASRRAAMETATDNADELIDDLNLEYNRKRQSNITQELNEIVGGANAV